MAPGTAWSLCLPRGTGRILGESVQQLVVGCWHQVLPAEPSHPQLWAPHGVLLTAFRVSGGFGMSHVPQTALPP